MYEIRIIVQICSSFRTFGNRCIRYAAICHSFIQFLIKVVQLSLIRIFAEHAKNKKEKNIDKDFHQFLKLSLLTKNLGDQFEYQYLDNCFAFNCFMSS